MCLLVSARARGWTDTEQLAAEAQRGDGRSRQLRDQALVEQAKGALMAGRGIAAAAALQLRQLVRRSDRPLAEVAASLLRRLGTAPPRGAPVG